MGSLEDYRSARLVCGLHQPSGQAALSVAGWSPKYHSTRSTQGGDLSESLPEEITFILSPDHTVGTESEKAEAGSNQRRMLGPQLQFTPVLGDGWGILGVHGLAGFL